MALFLTTLRRLILMDSNFVIFHVDSEIFLILRGLILMVARYVMFMFSTIVAEKKQIFGKLPKIYLISIIRPYP